MSRFIHPIKLIREKYLNHLKTHKLENLVLIVEAKYIIRINGGVSTVYTFLHADFEGVGCYAVRRYVHLKRYVIEEDFFVSEEEEEDDELLPVS